MTRDPHPQAARRRPGPDGGGHGRPGDPPRSGPATWPRIGRLVLGCVVALATGSYWLARQASRGAAWLVVSAMESADPEIRLVGWALGLGLLWATVWGIQILIDTLAWF